MLTEEELIEAHKHCSYNEQEIKNSRFCYCFYCRGRFRRMMTRLMGNYCNRHLARRMSSPILTMFRFQ